MSHAKSAKESIETGITGIAEGFENLQCREAADEISKYLKKHKQKHNLVTLYFANAYNGFVVSIKNPNEAISWNGFHYGIEYSGRVYCNVYPTGLLFGEWVNSFLAIDQETGRPVSPLITKTPLY